jgi:hypothetical protein
VITPLYKLNISFRHFSIHPTQKGKQEQKDPPSEFFPVQKQKLAERPPQRTFDPEAMRRTQAFCLFSRWKEKEQFPPLAEQGCTYSLSGFM